MFVYVGYFFYLVDREYAKFFLLLRISPKNRLIRNRQPEKSLLQASKQEQHPCHPTSYRSPNPYAVFMAAGIPA
jgi:hypothetical protein